MAWNKDEKPPASADPRVFNQSDIATGAVLLAIMALMAISRSAHYLLFHTMSELFAIVVSFSIFMLTWVGQRYLINGWHKAWMRLCAVSSRYHCRWHTRRDRSSITHMIIGVTQAPERVSTLREPWWKSRCQSALT